MIDERTTAFTENELYRKKIVFCLFCRGKFKYRAMPGSTTCLKHRQPSRRGLIRKLIQVYQQEVVADE